MNRLWTVQSEKRHYEMGCPIWVESNLGMLTRDWIHEL